MQSQIMSHQQLINFHVFQNDKTLVITYKLKFTRIFNYMSE